jgi:hypothetical protein
MRKDSMSYIRLSGENQKRRYEAMNMDSLRVSSTDQLRWAIKCYSRVLRHPVWVVLKYPYDNRVESTYLTVKKELGLTQTQRRPKWQIWPDAFTPTDGNPLYVPQE